MFSSSLLAARRTSTALLSASVADLIIRGQSEDRIGLLVLFRRAPLFRVFLPFLDMLRLFRVDDDVRERDVSVCVYVYVKTKYSGTRQYCLWSLYSYLFSVMGL